MDYTKLYNQLIEDFNLINLSDDDKKEMILEVSKTIQKQFLLDVYDNLGKEKFEALQASASMGDEFYATTLKHLLPAYEEVFKTSWMKIVAGFNKEVNG